MIEALKLAFADGVARVADPRSQEAREERAKDGKERKRARSEEGPAPIGDGWSKAYKAILDELLSDEYTAKRASLVRDGVAMDRSDEGELKCGLEGTNGETVFLTCVDGEGNGCSFICSYMDFGSGLVPKGCGFTLHNRGVTSD